MQYLDCECSIWDWFEIKITTGMKKLNLKWETKRKRERNFIIINKEMCKMFYYNIWCIKFSYSESTMQCYTCVNKFGWPTSHNVM